MSSPGLRVVVNRFLCMQVRAWWRDYFVEADAIVFVVDSADTDRITEAKEVLAHIFLWLWWGAHILFCSRQELAGLLADPALRDLKGFVVLGNKSDIHPSLDLNQLIASLALTEPMEAVLPAFTCVGEISLTL